jgi:hypothetical protein
MSLARIAGNQEVDRAIANLLVHAIQSPEDYSAIEQSCWADGQTVVAYVSRFLCGVKGDAASAAEEALINALGSQKHFQAQTVAEALLALAFDGPIGRGTPFTSLNERQQKLLKVLTRNRHIWGVQSGKDFIEDVDASYLMRAYGLPDRLVTMEQYISPDGSLTAPPPAAVQSGNIIARVKRWFQK